MAKITDMSQFSNDIYSDDSKKEKHSKKTEVKTLLQFHKLNADLIDCNGRIKVGMTFSAPKQSNIKPYSTELDRYRAANYAAHRQTNCELLADDVKIQYTGKALAGGAEIWSVCKDGLDVLPNGAYVTKAYQVFSVQKGKVAEVVTDKFKASAELKSLAFQAAVDKAQADIDSQKETPAYKRMIAARAGEEFRMKKQAFNKI